MRMFGITLEGISICCHVHGFSPYVFVTAPKTFNESHCQPFKVICNILIINKYYIYMLFILRML